ncbi:MAG TPA: hypothetical protein ENG14_05835 [Thermodesulforhabdus norvegica]|uniref:Uncharacterized protein n=1 Tax=Thermodesulforhabdus norvegica TaxID=39841 RepID=A0A7C0WVV8_9BACT|nr:hypothetical protein [Thermodesulforhabdus norvegica]
MLRGIIQPIQDMFVIMYGLTEPIISQLTSEHPNWIYSHIAVLAWLVKFLSAVVGATASNSTLVAAFNDTLHTLSVKSNTFFGNLSGKSGMSYIAKHAYYELLNNKTLAIDLSTKFVRALNSTVTFVMKGFEFL